MSAPLDASVRPDAPSLGDYWSLRFAAAGPPPTQLFAQRIGALLAFTAMHSGLSPSGVTLLGLLCSIAASLLYGLGEAGYPAMILSLLAYQLGYCLDCADGQLARATKRTSEFGAWLDVSCDHVRNVSIAIALAWLFIHGSSIPTPVVFLSVGVVLAGITVSLHTSTEIRRFGISNKRPKSAAVRLLQAPVTSVMDTPIFLLLLCLLRDSTWGLCLYIITMGVGYLGLSAVVAWLRLPRT